LGSVGAVEEVLNLGLHRQPSFVQAEGAAPDSMTILRLAGLLTKTPRKRGFWTAFGPETRRDEALSGSRASSPRGRARSRSPCLR
jgi:hypothetical protein